MTRTTWKAKVGAAAFGLAMAAVAFPALAETTPDKCATLAPATTRTATMIRQLALATADADMQGAIAEFDGAARAGLERVEVSRKALLPLLEDYAEALEAAAAAMRACSSGAP